MFENINVILGVQLLIVMVLLILFYDYMNTKIKHLIIAKKLPGPKALPIIGNALDFITINGNIDLLSKLLLIFEKNGNIFRFWQGTELNIGIVEPKYIEIILKNSKSQQKSSMYKYLEVLLGRGLITGSGQLQKDHRTALLSTLKSHIFESNGSVKKISNQCNLLTEKLKPFSDGEIFNIWYKISLCLFTIVNQTLLGIDDMSCQDEKYIPLLNSWQKSGDFVTERMSNILYRSDIICKFTKRYKELKDLIKMQDVHCKKILEQKIKLNPNISLDRMLSSNGLNETECLKTINGLILISQESTATTISFLLLMLAMHQQIQAKVYQEVIEVFHKDGDIEISLDKFSSLHYLDLCMKETLRLFPTGPLLMRELIDDVKLNDNIILPAKCVAVLFIYYLHRNPEIWPEPNKFIPERFTDEQSAKRHPYAYVPFSAGPMDCVGKWFAGITVKSVVASIIRKYHVETNLKSMEDIKLYISISLRSKNGFPVRLLPR